MFTIILFRNKINQNVVGMNSNPMAVLIQFNRRLLISFVGSKFENRFLITSICFVDVYGAFCFLCLFGDWMK